MTFHVPEQHRWTPERAERSGYLGELASTRGEGNNGLFILRAHDKPWVLFLVASEGMPGVYWEHVSVSLKRKNGAPIRQCPTWEQMCFVKDLFWDPEDCVVQYHPPASEHVNYYPWCLHLWRPTNAVLPQPPAITVGPIGPEETNDVEPVCDDAGSRPAAHGLRR